VTVTGLRQSGKTTFCHTVFPEKPYSKLERHDVREFARNDPLSSLSSYPAGANLNEIERVPQLLSYPQPLTDEHNDPGIYILTGRQRIEVLTTIARSPEGRAALY
jgi:uncharacterized protein